MNEETVGIAMGFFWLGTISGYILPRQLTLGYFIDKILDKRDSKKSNGSESR